MAEALIKYETIDSSQIKEIMSGKEPSPPQDWEPVKKTDKDGDNSAPARAVDQGSIDKPASEH